MRKLDLSELKRGDILHLEAQLAEPGGPYRVLGVRSGYVKLQLRKRAPISLTPARLRELVTDGPEFGPAEGVLAAVGYCVGRSGVSTQRRRAILRSLIDRPYRKLPKVSGVREWGAAKTKARMTKLLHCLASFAANAQRRMNPPRSAIADWEKDLEWLRTEYGSWLGIDGATG